MVQDRRLYQRLSPNSPQLVLLDESKYSLLSDLSEGGVAVEGFAAQNPFRPIALEFDMPEGSGCIRARGEAVWTSDSGHRTGFRFVDIPETSRRQLREWVSTASAARMAAIDGEVNRPTFVSSPLEFQSDSRSHRVDFSTFPALQPGLLPRSKRPLAQKDENSGSHGGALHVTSVVAATVVISSTAFLLGYYWRAGRPKQPIRSVASAAKSSDSNGGAFPVASSQSAAGETVPPMLPLDAPGFILQVGAMNQEANADTLSDELRKKNFSAFVFRRSADRFYRVAVGPYPEKDAAAQTKKDLEQQGYNSILRPWTPE